MAEVFAITRMNCSVAIKVGYWPCYWLREARATPVIDDEMRTSPMDRALLEGIGTLIEGDWTRLRLRRRNKRERNRNRFKLNLTRVK